MTPTNPDDIIAALDTLLDRERRAILAGELEVLAPLMAEKSALIDALTTLSATATAGDSSLDGLRAKARRNQDLIEAAMDGIRAVALRLAAMRRLRGTMETYDSAGQRRPIHGLRGGKVEKRA